MGVILDYAKMRLDDVKREAAEFAKKPLDYILNKQILRKAVLLEWLDNVRPVVGTRYEHFVEQMKRT